MKFKCNECGCDTFSTHNETNTTFHGEITSLEFSDLETDRWYATCLDCKSEWGPASTLPKLEGLMVREGVLR